MYICLCKQVTDTQIKDAVCNGASCLRDVSQCLGVASQCGKCGVHAKNIIQAAKTETKK